MESNQEKKRKAMVRRICRKVLSLKNERVINDESG